MPAINCLPLELFLDILSLVKQTSRSSLRNCLVVSRLWNQRACPLLYRRVVLDSPVSTRKFCAFISHRYAPQVESLALDLGSACSVEAASPGLEAGRLDTFYDIVEPRMRKLRQDLLLPSALRILSKLSTFSLVILPIISPVSAGFPVAELAAIIDALPESCVNLELDTGGWDDFPKQGDPHLCASIRRILPRMQHVRLRLRFVCSAIFGEGHLVPSDQWRARSICSTEEYQPTISLPNMRTLLVNCAVPDRDMRDTCRPDDWADLSPEELITRTTWHVLTSALERLVNRGDCHSASAKIHVHDFMSGCPIQMKLYHSPYTTFIRTEMTSLTT
jgi:hypothetical protein